MIPFSEDIRQHDTHSALVGQTGPKEVSPVDRKLDAIVVPASRRASHLDHAVTLARLADCSLVILCSQRLRGLDVRRFLAERSFTKAIVIDLPRGYSHELLRFPALRSLKDELPPACGYYVTDLSMKRNIGLVLARMMRWRRIFFLDDDIRDINYPDLQTTVNMLGSFSAAGMWVTDYPDNSIVCHANRETGGFQDVFVSGAALAVDCDDDIGFFPDIYNEDWLFFFDDASNGRLANSCLKATQLCYYPFANPRRAAWQEFGDVLAEGIYALLHLGLGVQQATREYWSCFIEERRIFLEEIANRSDKVHSNIRAEMLTSVQSAQKCLLKIKPDLCERYVQLWRQDLEDWKRRVAEIPEMPSLEAALQMMRLSPPARKSSTRKILHRPDRVAQIIAAGPVAIPRFDTLKGLSERVSILRLSTAVSIVKKGDTKPLPLAGPEYSAAELTGMANGDDSPSSGAEGLGQDWKRRFGSTLHRLGNIRDATKPPWRASVSASTPQPELELVGSSEPAEPEP